MDLVRLSHKDFPMDSELYVLKLESLADCAKDNLAFLIFCHFFQYLKFFAASTKKILLARDLKRFEWSKINPKIVSSLTSFNRTSPG